MTKELKKRQGITLIELLVVIVILGTLMGILYKFVLNPPDTESLAHRSQIMGIQAALMSYLQQCQELPSDEEGLMALVKAPSEHGLCATRTFISPDMIQHKGCHYLYKKTGNSSYEIYWLGDDCAEGGEGKNADLKLASK